jgi:endonuclease/exonuclease/phosphatase family metal-dependent hydrolase
MKPLLFFEIIFFFTSLLSYSQIGSIATYNIRYDGHTDLANDWSERKVPISSYVLKNHIDVIGFQEVLNNQLLDLKTLLPNYQFVGVGRDDGQDKGEYSPIFYDTTKFEVLSSGTFWLSPTPEIPSKGWDAALNRICTFVLLKKRNNPREFIWVFNTHFDHVGIEARWHSVELIQAKIKELQSIKSAPILLTGDFNMEPNDKGINLMKGNFKDLTFKSDVAETVATHTFNGFTMDQDDDKRIDYIFGSDRIISLESKVDQATFGRSYPSDHFPVMLVYKILR